MATVITIISWCLWAGICACLNADEYTMQRNEIESYNIREFDNVVNFTTEKSRIEELRDKSSLTLKHEMNISCKEPDLFFKGYDIKISRVIKFFSKSDSRNNCADLYKLGKLKFLNIFALNTLIINDDIHSLEEVESMIVIAPKWNVIGSRRIEIGGANGESQSTRNARKSTKDATFHGINGRPGKPGRPGGNFFGIGKVFINGANLTISVNGGNGSAGEDGVNGKNGDDGADSKVPHGKDCSDVSCDSNEQINLYKCKKECETKVFGREEARAFDYFSECTYDISGNEGLKGRDGGNGGKGGKSGNAGHIQLIEFKVRSGILQSKSTGQAGLDGKGGLGGDGGKRGKGIIVKCFRDDWTFVKTTPSKEKAASGKNGLPGNNTKDMKEPKKITDMSNLNKAKAINRYKSYLRENLIGRAKNKLEIFLKQLEKNNKVKRVYDALGLIDDFKTLENHYNKLSENVDFLPFYESLLNRVSDYAQHFSENVDRKLYKKVLGYLYTVTLGRISNLEDELESSLIIDVKEYLISVKEDIKKLADLQDAKSKTEIINGYKDDYKQQIDVKINEATEIISKEIIPEIDNIAAQTNNEVEVMLSGVTNLIKNAKIKHEDLKKEKEKLLNAMIFQDVISALKIVGTVVSFMGPVGLAAGAVIGVGSTLAETAMSVSSSSTINPELLEKPVASLNTLKDTIQGIKDKKVDNFKTLLESVSQEASKFPKEFSDISKKVTDYKSKLDKMGEKKINSKNLAEIKSMEKELKATLKTKAKEFPPIKKGGSDQKSKSAAIGNMENAVALSSSMLDAYNTHNENQAKIDVINDAINQNKETFQVFKQLEDKIYDSIAPMVQNIQTEVDSYVDNFAKKSVVALDVTKWKVKSTLGEIIRTLQQLNDNFKLNSKITLCIENMREAILTLITVHEHIRDFQKEQTFANFIADINSITVSNSFSIQDKNLQDALNDLEITLRSSIIYQRYRVAIDALKMAVFPFAHLYLKNLYLPSHLKLDEKSESNSLQDLVSVAVKEIDEISKELKNNRTTISKYDSCSFTGYFRTEYKSKQAFYVWDNSTHKHMISELLSGQIVTVTADVKDSTPYEDAVKFKSINFNFTSGHVGIQRKINHVLKDFEIHADYLGNSYYRFNNKTYLMSTNVLEDISYTFMEYSKGVPEQTSAMYEKIKNGDFLLSPYATWKIWLINDKGDTSFKNLQKFKGKVDLEMGGYGYYVNTRKPFCAGVNVDKYYKAINF